MIFSQVPVRAWFATLALGCFGLVAIGMELQALLHLAPCPMCIFQRMIYLVIGLVGLLGFAWPGGRPLWALFAGGLAVLGVAVAGYQTWMQAFPELAKECSYADPNLMESLVEWMGMQFPSLFLATGFCASRDWEFLSMSMANWSVLIFAGIIGYAGWLALRRN